MYVEESVHLRLCEILCFLRYLIGRMKITGIVGKKYNTAYAGHCLKHAIFSSTYSYLYIKIIKSSFLLLRHRYMTFKKIHFMIKEFLVL